jgi:hypothetical protein
MILTGENSSARRKTCSSATLSAMHVSWTILGLVLRTHRYKLGIKKNKSCNGRSVAFVDIHLNSVQDLGILTHIKR